MRIIRFINQHRMLLVWGSLLGAYLVTRLARLDLIPIFTDEAIYLRWSQLIAENPVYKYLPLTDGKPPLFMWVVGLVMRVWPDLDPLLSGRLVSVGSGLVALGGIYFASWQLFQSKTVSTLSGLLYVVSPFTFFYDRFGLVDGMLASWAVWSLGLGVWLAKTLNFKVAVLFGLVNGLGLLTKIQAVFFLLYSPLHSLFLRKGSGLKEKARLGALIICSLAISIVIFSYLFTLPESHLITAKNSQFTITLGEFLTQPFKLFLGNLRALLYWEISYLSWPVLLLIIWSAVRGIKDGSKEKLLLVGYFVFYLLSMAMFNKVIYPRFLLVFTPMLLILAAVGLSEIKKHVRSLLLFAICCLLFVAPSLYTDWKLLTDPPSAPIADNDSYHYLNGWPAGYGVKEVRQFLQEQSRQYSKVTVATEGTFGLMPFALQLYQKDYPNVEIKALWPPPDGVPEEIIADAADHPTFYLIYQRSSQPQGRKLQLIMEFVQGRGTEYLRLYKILP